MGRRDSAGWGRGFHGALAKKVRARRSLALPCCISLWSGWRGFGLGGKGRVIECRSTGVHRRSRAERIGWEGRFGEMYDPDQKVRGEIMKYEV
jgi:hypothetical protein